MVVHNTVKSLLATENYKVTLTSLKFNAEFPLVFLFGSANESKSRKCI